MSEMEISLFPTPAAGTIEYCRLSYFWEISDYRLSIFLLSVLSTVSIF